MKKILISISFLILFSCISGKDFSKIYENYEKLKDFPIVEKCEMKKFNNVTYFQHVRIKIFNNKYLIVMSKKNDNVIEIYELSTGKLIDSFGQIGHGPGEFIGPYNILIDNEKNQFGIWDASLNKITNYKYFNNNHTFEMDNIITVSLDAGRPIRITQMKNNTYAGIGLLTSRICLYNEHGDTIKTNKYIPGSNSKKNDMTPMYLAEEYRGQIRYNKYNDQILVCNFSTDLIEFYDDESNIKKTLHGPDFFVPKSISRNNRLIIKTKQRAYVDLCFSCDKIICLYSGKITSKTKKKTNEHKEKIFVLNHNGVPIKKLELHENVWQIDYCDLENKLYAVCANGEEIYIGYCEF